VIVPELLGFGLFGGLALFDCEGAGQLGTRGIGQLAERGKEIFGSGGRLLAVEGPGPGPFVNGESVGEFIEAGDDFGEEGGLEGFPVTGFGGGFEFGSAFLFPPEGLEEGEERGGSPSGGD